ncbi:MAG: ribosome assembly RNA-binding protein YhbY [Bacillota bacterium]
MLTGKQKRYLRSLGVNLDPVLHVGKEGVGATVVDQAASALAARGLIKVRVLETAPAGADEVGASLADATQADLVQVIGRNLLLYKPSPDKAKIQLPERSQA